MTLEPRERQLRDESLVMRYPTREYQIDQPSEMPLVSLPVRCAPTFFNHETENDLKQSLDWSIHISLYTSQNSENSVDYFSPKQDLAVTVALQGERLIWQRYESTFGDRLVLGAGNYWQEDYGNGLIADVTYQQFYQIDPYVEVNYGVGWSRRIYDGEPENAIQLSLNLVVRF